MRETTQDRKRAGEYLLYSMIRICNPLKHSSGRHHAEQTRLQNNKRTFMLDGAQTAMWQDAENVGSP